MAAIKIADGARIGRFVATNCTNVTNNPNSDCVVIGRDVQIDSMLSNNIEQHTFASYEAKLRSQHEAFFATLDKVVSELPKNEAIKESDRKFIVNGIEQAAAQEISPEGVSRARVILAQVGDVCKQVGCAVGASLIINFLK